MSAPVLVTGGTGFVAGHLVAQLLEAGRHVRASVRPGTSAHRRAHLEDLAATRPGRLEVVVADLLDARRSTPPSPGARWCSTSPRRSWCRSRSPIRSAS